MFRVLGHPLRLAILRVMAEKPSTPVRPVDLALDLEFATPFTVAHALKLLTQAGFVVQQGRVRSSSYYILSGKGQKVLGVMRDVSFE
ncbi:MAG TPA: hypothetical protein VMV94_07050 [Phycisphaerae bacterium]|nr:hypothetical protein [Phycisphaerae bacterium]